MGLRSRAMARKAVPPMPDVPKRCPQCHSPVAERFPHAVMYECGYARFNDGQPVTDDYPAECQRRRIKRLEKQFAAARAEAEALRKHIEALEAFVHAEKACRDHAATCSYYDWKPGACPICKRLMRARDEAYRRALAVMDIADGGVTHA